MLTSNESITVEGDSQSSENNARKNKKNTIYGVFQRSGRKGNPKNKYPHQQ